VRCNLHLQNGGNEETQTKHNLVVALNVDVTRVRVVTSLNDSAALFVLLPQKEQVFKTRHWRCTDQVWSDATCFIDEGDVSTTDMNYQWLWMLHVLHWERDWHSVHWCRTSKHTEIVLKHILRKNETAENICTMKKKTLRLVKDFASQWLLTVFYTRGQLYILTLYLTDQFYLLLLLLFLPSVV